MNSRDVQPALVTSETRFSAWTPVSHRPSNHQLFQERTTLVLHWFDLWTDRQRKQFIHSILTRCSRSQLKFTRDRFLSAVPATHADFTTVLPRFLSLYVLSFLNPLDLCSAAQVCWHWKFLAEQDCLWLPKCVRRGWFLPYTPGEREYGSWKCHYVACARSLDYLTPREAAEVYGTLNELLGDAEELEERRRERHIRQLIREKVAEHKSEQLDGVWERSCKSPSLRSHPQTPSLSPSAPPPRLLLISSRIPAYEMVLSAARGVVVPLLYDHSGTTLEALLSRVERSLRGRGAQSVAVLAEGDEGQINLLQGGCPVTRDTVLKPDVREFWEKLGGLVVPPAEGGSLFIFAPLAASGQLKSLSSLTGLNISAPVGLATGSYQSILGEWEGGSAFPPWLYFSEAPLLSWAKQARWLEEALGALRENLGSQLKQLSQEMRGRALGESPGGLRQGPPVTEAVAEGLETLSGERCVRDSHGSPDGRTAAFRELVRSEGVYVRQLRAVARVYHVPLRAALDSNRAILSSANVLMVFSSLLEILEVNKVFLEELTEKMAEWDPLQSVGDVCLKLCSRLRAYTNFLKNYPTILRTIDRCREKIPAFRAFLKRHDRTLATGMLSLPELLLLPSSRIEEYVPLLQALLRHTAPEHPDRPQLSTALDTLSHYRDFVRKVNPNMSSLPPSLREGNRHLIAVQEVALLSCPDVQIAVSLRVYEHMGDMGLFLFNDVLVLTQRSVSHLPFSYAQRTSHTFLASVFLRGLAVHDITDTKYVKNAFVLEGPRQRWTCATDEEGDKVTWLSALHRAISATVRES
uniref:Epithelial cell transforming 2 like n=1 Tax=Scleropages formosus TaxID=113540 RepID=A0A8C9RYX9_SCLFO